MRAALLLRMGEAEAARALVQDVDTGSYTPALTAAALDAYVATADFTGICPVMATQRDVRRDPQWQVAQIICTGFQGDGSGALTSLDRALYRGLMPRIDMLLAQKYVGAAGKARRAVTIEWDGVDEITPWRYGLAIAVGRGAAGAADGPGRAALFLHRRHRADARPCLAGRRRRPGGRGGDPFQRGDGRSLQPDLFRRRPHRRLGRPQRQVARRLYGRESRCPPRGDADSVGRHGGSAAALFAPGVDRLCGRAVADRRNAAGRCGRHHRLDAGRRARRQCRALGRSGEVRKPGLGAAGACHAGCTRRGRTQRNRRFHR